MDASKVYIKPDGTEHSLIELLYHMITWASFTLTRLDNSSLVNLAVSEKMDWRRINPSVHSWVTGMSDFKKIHKEIISLLEKKDDSFLSEMVDERKHNYCFLLNGLIQHTIYHLGQIAYLSKMQ